MMQTIIRLTDCSLSFSHLNEANLIEIIKSLNPSKSSGIDDLPTKFVVDAIEARPLFVSGFAMFP